MPKHCASAGCRENYCGEPYCVPVVKFPRDQEERQRWIDAMPNDPETLKNRKDIYICSSHFDCEWVKIRAESTLQSLHLFSLVSLVPA